MRYFRPIFWAAYREDEEMRDTPGLIFIDVTKKG
jgi:hypothetical protein